MGSKSKSYQVRKRDPESAELKNMRTSIYNMLAPITGAAPMDMIVPQVGGGVSGANADAAVSRGKPSRSFANGLPQGYEMDSRGQIISGYKGGGDNEGAPIYARNADGSIATIWNYNSGGGSSSQAAIPSGGAGTKWSETNFGSDWLTNRARVANALNQYDTLSRNTQPLMNKVTGTADRIAALSGANLGIVDNINDLTTRIANTAEGNLQYSNRMADLAGKIPGLADKIAGLSDRIPGLSNRISAVGDKALTATDAAAASMQPNTQNISALAGKIRGVGDRQRQLSDEILDFTRTGNVPSAVLENLNQAVNSELNRNTGSALNDLAARGVMNSSVANRSLGGLVNSAADAYAKNYLGAYNSVLSGYGQTNNTLAGAGDTYAKAIGGYNTANDNLRSNLASQLAGYNTAGNMYNNAISGLRNAMGGYNDAIGGYNSAINGYSNVVNGRNSTINGYNTAIGGYNSMLNGVNNTVNGLNAAMGGYGKALTTNADLMKQAASMPQTLSQALMAQYAPAYQFWKDLQNSYDNREDYDTVVKQGK